MSDLVSRIEKLIKEKGTNFKRVEQEIGLGNGTIKRWSEQSPRLDKLVLVSEYLQASLDYLVFGNSVSENCASESDLCEDSGSSAGYSCNGVPLSQPEADLIAMFRLLPDDARKEIFDLTHFKYKRIESGEKDSIYWTYFAESSKVKSGPAESRKTPGGTA